MMIARKISIQGTAIKAGVSKNGILYSVEELNDFAPTLVGRPILKDHKGETDQTVGIVTDAFSDENGIVAYKGWVKEDGTNLIDKIKDGRIKEVSIGAFVGKIVKDKDDERFYPSIDKPWSAQNMEAMELSTTPVPAVKGTSLRQSLESLEKHKTNEKVKVVPIFENTKVFEDIEKLNEVKEMADDEKAKEPESKDSEQKEETEKKEAVKESKEKEEPKKVEEKKQSVKLDIDVDSSKLDETIEKQNKILENAEKIMKLNKKDESKETKEKTEEIKKEVKEEIKETTRKGKVAKEEEDSKKENLQESVAGEYIVENSEYGDGFSLFKQPDADGSLR